MRMIFTTTAFAAATISSIAFAQTMATAGTDLNIRSGPGVQHEVIGVINNGNEVSVAGCIDSVNWCEISSDGQAGWAYGDYLTAKVGEEIQPLYPNRQEIGVMIIEAPAQEEDTSGQDTAVAGTTGAVMGALIGGPIGAVAGAAIGGAAGAASVPEPAPEIRTYITSNSADSVLLDGEVVVGAGVPETVTLQEISDYPDYRYARINGQDVLVSPTTRQVIYIYR